MKKNTKHLLVVAGGFAFGYWLYGRLFPKKTGLAGLGESNPLVGQIPGYDFRNRKVRAWGSHSAPPLDRSVAPMVALDDVREAPVAKYSFGDNGFGRY